MLHQVYQFGLRPLLFRLDPEAAHGLAIAFAKTVNQSRQLHRTVAKFCVFNDSRLHQYLWGIDFSNPVGLAAGFDKNAQATEAWAAFGFGFAEVGTITVLPQVGNPQPRLFRLPADHAILNRMGFNNCGAEAVVAFLQEYRQRNRLKSCLDFPLGINLGKSKTTPLEQAKDDYVTGFKLLKDLGDYFVINVSSPNTPGLRDLQAAAQLPAILEAVQHQNTQNKPILVKIAPDLNDDDIRQIARMCVAHQVAGIIATNTAIARHNLKTQIIAATGKPVSEEAGGISGKPLKERSTQTIRLIWQETGGKLPIIGVGGIFTAEDAWEKITAGATLVQIYTGWIYQGPLVIREILQGLVKKLEVSGLEHISQAVGLSHRING